MMTLECDEGSQPKHLGGVHAACVSASSCHTFTSGRTPGAEYAGTGAEPQGGCGPPMAATVKAGIANASSGERSSFNVLVHPKASISIRREHRVGSSDHLIGTQQDGFGNRDAEVVRGFKVDHELVARWLFHRQIRWLGTFQNLVCIDGARLQ